MSGKPATLPAVVRCVTLLRCLLEHGKVYPHDAAKALGEAWPERTFQRDVHTLKEAGVNIETIYEPDGSALAFRGFKK